MSAFSVVLLVVLGLTACALVLLAIETGRESERGNPSAAELTRARRRADVLAFREAELAELRSQGPLVDGQLPARSGHRHPIGGSVGYPVADAITD